MQKIKRLALITMLAAVVSVVAACGNNGNSGTMTESSYPMVNDVTNGQNGNVNPNNGETGGVLRDMVDDVEQGINDVTDDLGNETTYGPEENTRP